MSTLPALWAEQWASRADRPVLWDPFAGWVSGGELEELSRQAAATLLEGAVPPGSRVGIVASTTVAFVAVYAGILRAGLVAMPISAGSTRADLALLLEDARPAALVADPQLLDHLASAPRRHRPALFSVHTQRTRWGRPLLRPEPFGGGGSHAQRVAPAGMRLDGARPEDVALLCYTSGTTGRPKGVPLSHANLVAGTNAFVEAWRWDADDRLVLSLPLHHVHGLGVGVNGSLLTGGSAVLLPRFDPGAVADELARHRATLFFGVPAMYQRLVAAGRAEALGPLRVCVSGSAPLPTDLHSAVRVASGQLIVERYGMTETMLIASNPYDGERRPGTVGFALPGVEIRLTTPGEGEILVRGPAVFGGYLERPDENADSFDGDGWFHTGDVGRFDVDGYLSVVARRKELIITGGEKVAPLEVEDVLRRQIGVVDVGVVGTPSAAWGEEVVAFVVGTGGLAPASVHAFARGELAAHKRPKRVVMVDAIPRNALGKIERHVLRRRLESM